MILPIGGYFELEASNSSNQLLSECLAFQSARAALYFVLAQVDIDRLWLPHYVCHSVINAAEKLNIPISYYSLDHCFEPIESIELGERDVMLYVNYFGVNDRSVEKILSVYSPDRIILDCSQALFYQVPDGVFASIYSPRKFLGVPDGGLLKSSKDTGYDQLATDSTSSGRMTHLRQRLNGEVEKGYQTYQKAEASLSDCLPKKMSGLTRELLSAVDIESIKKKRRENFLFLHEHLQMFNELTLSLDEQVPLCYPLLVRLPDLRERLIDEKVFVPCYWPELKNNNTLSSFEDRLVQDLIPIPCDQRYGPEQLLRVIHLITEVRHEYSR